MKKYERIFVIVLDSLGIGAMPDSEKFGDVGVDTFGHILDKMGSLEIPNLKKLGMLNLHPAGNMQGVEKPIGRYMRVSEASNGKVTMTGHWEMMGIKTEKPFKTFTDTGFPPELIAELEKRCGKRVIGNKSASGTEIIEELGEEEIHTGAMIVYTSADSVLQICGNEETFDLQNLYRCCEIAREITRKDEWRVGRVIARPYVGKKKGELKTYQIDSDTKIYKKSGEESTEISVSEINPGEMVSVETDGEKATSITVSNMSAMGQPGQNSQDTSSGK